jgi:hypothetical protein
MTSNQIELAKLIAQGLGLIGTFIAAVLAVRTYRRTEQWKRAEFVAKEMKEFFDNLRVQNALLLIDWGIRRIPLLSETAPDNGQQAAE